MPDDSGTLSKGGRGNSTLPEPPRLKKEGGCCSVSREENAEVIEQHLHCLHDEFAKQTATSTDSIHELQNMLKIVNLIKEQQTSEFAKFSELMNDLVAQQKGVMDHQENLKATIVQQKETLENQGTLVQQVLDQLSLDKAFENIERSKYKLQQPKWGQNQNGLSKSFDEKGYNATGNGSLDSAKTMEYDEFEKKGPKFAAEATVTTFIEQEDDEKSEYGHQVEPLERKSTRHHTKSKKDAKKNNRKSVEGRSNINVAAAPWNQEHDKSNGEDALTAEEKEEEEPDDPLFPCLTRLARSSKFKFFFSVLILVNTIFVAVQVNETAKQAQYEAPPVYLTVSDMAFCLAFVIEIVIRMLVERCSFFRGETKYWNLFDLALVVLAFQEQVSAFVLIARGEAAQVMEGGGGGEETNFTFLRMVRMLRVLRVLRVLKFCPQLIVLVQGILESMSAMIWLFALLALTLFIMSLIFMSATANFLKARFGEDETEHMAQMKNYFGTLSDSFLSLFKSITGGIEWEKLGDGLMKIGNVYGCLFLLYLSFVIFCIVNVMTGVFVISAMRTAKQTDEDVKRRHFSELKEFIESLAVDFDEPNIIDRDMYMLELEAEESSLKDLLRPLELGSGDAAHLFDIMMDKRGKVETVKLTSAFLRLLGGAKSTDLVFLLLEVRRMANELFGFFCFSEANFRTLATAVGVANGARRYIQK